MKQLVRILALAQASQEPTVASIPGILIRALMRTTARLVFLIAGLVLVASLLLFHLSLFFATWPSVHKRR